MKHESEPLHKEKTKKRWIRPVVAAMAMAAAGIALYGAGQLFIHNEPQTPQPTVYDHGLSGDPQKQLLASHIISTFENSTTAIQYGYAENIKDGRGITAGRAGFTSGTGDLLLVVQRYAAKVTEVKTKNPSLADKKDPLSHYLPALQAINGKPEGERDTTEGLDGFVEAWHQAAKDPDFKSSFEQAQDEIYNELYFGPAMEQAQRVGIKSSLGQFAILDAAIQQGIGEDKDGLPAMLAETTKKAPPASRNEPAWLTTFLDVREYHLTHAADPSTRQAWKESVSRVHVQQTFLRNRNLTLAVPIHWEVYGDGFSCQTADSCHKE